MGAVTTLSSPRLSVAPGESVQLEVTVRNQGHVVDEFTIEGLGVPAEWASVEPESVRLLPDTAEQMTVTFTPPRDSAIKPGTVPFGLRIVSQEDPTGAVVEEGVLDIGKFSDTSAELLPRTSRARGRGRGKHELAVDNRGNGALDVQVTPTDPTEKLEIELESPRLAVESGQAAFLPVRVRAQQRFWRGPAVTHNFQLLLEPSDETPLVVEGTFVQEAVIPKWLPKLLAALLALALLAVALWYLVVKPAVKDAAKEQAKKTAQAAGAAAGKQAAQQQTGPQPGPQPTNGPAPAPNPTTGTTTVNQTASGTPVFYRLQAGATSQSPSVSFGKQVLSITDVVLENPKGDSGLVSFQCGSKTLLQTELANFRDLDYHFVAPVACGPNTKLSYVVACSHSGAGGPCTPAISVDGYLRNA
jgi:hypothetical protein